jgi:hypothetical protein
MAARAAEAAKAKRFRVIAPYVTARTAAAAGMLPGGRTWTVIGFYRDAFLPEDCPAEDVDRLLGKDMVEEVEVG